MSNSISHYFQSNLDSSSGFLQVLENITAVRMFDKGRVIYHQGDTPDCFYYLKKGRVKIFITSEGGTEKTLSVIGKGAILGEASFFDGQPRMSSARAIARCELVSINKNILTDIIRKNPQTAMELLRLQAQTIRMLSAQVDSMTFTGATVRIAQFLIQSSHNSGSDTVAVTHEEIGSVVGVSRVTVSKIISRFVAEGIVKTGYKSIMILNKKRLSELYEQSF